jgi:D-amino-acid oxidase
LLSESEIPAPFKIGITFDTVSVNPLEYLPWLRSELESRGVVFRRKHVNSLDEIKPSIGTTGILVNATSLGGHILSICPWTVIDGQIQRFAVSDWSRRYGAVSD